MRKWLQTRGRAILSLLSDAGGALAFVVLAAGLLAAAITGVVLVTLDLFPQPFLTLFVVGVASLAAGLTLHLLRGSLKPVAPAPPPQVAPGVTSPYAQAAALQRQHDDEKTQLEERNRALAERRALRWVREELLDNKRWIERSASDIEELWYLTDQHWQECEATLLELENPAPHAKARRAYREIAALKQADGPTESDAQSATEAIDDAVKALSAVEHGVSEDRIRLDPKSI